METLLAIAFIAALSGLLVSLVAMYKVAFGKNS